MALHVIVGKGPVGTTTAEALLATGHQVRVLSRSGGRSTDAMEARQGDARAAAPLRGTAAGSEGSPRLTRRLCPRRPAAGPGYTPLRPRRTTAGRPTGP